MAVHQHDDAVGAGGHGRDRGSLPRASPRFLVETVEEVEDLAARRWCRGCRWARRRGGGGGPMTMARARATRWRSPPESWSGRWSMRSARPTAASAAVTRSRRSPRATAGEDHGQLDVLGGGQARHQVEGLEDEADEVAADARQLRRRESGPRRGRRAGRSRCRGGRGSRGGRGGSTCRSRKAP